MTLPDRTVHVWRAPLDLPANVTRSLWQLLSDDERRRAERFHFPGHRDRFTHARGILRDVLSQYTGVHPGQLTFRYGEHGKPAVAGAAVQSDVRFSLSHTDKYAVLAFVIGCEVGVDVERIRTLAHGRELTRMYLSPSEHAELEALAPEAWDKAFFECWTRKEAFTKGLGVGLAMPLDSFDVTASPADRPYLKRTADPAHAARWSLHALDLPAAYVGTVAVEGSSLALVYHDWQPVTSSVCGT